MEEVETPRHFGVVACLAGSATALAVSPLLMPSTYSWISHTTSESAAQGLEGAWMSRLGFVCFGLGVLWLAHARPLWGAWARVSHVAFGVLMLAASAFSHRPFMDGVAYDPAEDVLHSISATVMGFAFAVGVTAVALQRTTTSFKRRTIDLMAVLASVVIPLGMTASDGTAGLLQRGMFLVAYIWYGSEALTLWSPGAPTTETLGDPGE